MQMAQHWIHLQNVVIVTRSVASREKYGLRLKGWDRVRALRSFYNDKTLPEGLEAFTITPLRILKWEDIRWETAGSRVLRDGVNHIAKVG
jgi:hypothetical protein